MDRELLLYAVTDRSWSSGTTLYEQVEAALQGGVTMLQLREKDLPEPEFLEEALAVRELCSRYQVPLIINDNVDIAEKADADGVHVGQEDMGVSAVRERLGPDKIIGVSARTVEQALQAESQGADYLGAGAVFPTGTKPEASALDYGRLKEICAAVSIPVAAIGGIGENNLELLAGSGISGVAVVSGIFAQPDITLAAKGLRQRMAMLGYWERFLEKERVSGVIFDVDGTLLDSMPVWENAAEHYLDALGIKAEDALGRRLFPMTMQQGAGYLKETYHLSQSVEDIRAGVDRIVMQAYEKEVMPKPGMSALLKILQEAGIPMTVVTSTDEPLVLAAFRRLGLTGYFTDILTSSGFGSGKEKPEIFRAAAHRMGSRLSDTWVVEDGLYAIRTAKAAGFRVIGMADAFSREDQEAIKGLADRYIPELLDGSSGPERTYARER